MFQILSDPPEIGDLKWGLHHPLENKTCKNIPDLYGVSHETWFWMEMHVDVDCHWHGFGDFQWDVQHLCGRKGNKMLVHAQRWKKVWTH